MISADPDVTKNKINLTYKFKFNPLSDFGVKVLVQETVQFRSECLNFNENPECSFSLVTNKPPYPSIDQFSNDLKVLATDHKNYAIIRLCMDIDFLGFKYASENILVLTRMQDYKTEMSSDLQAKIDSELCKIFKDQGLKIEAFSMAVNV